MELNNQINGICNGHNHKPMLNGKKRKFDSSEVCLT